MTEVERLRAEIVNLRRRIADLESDAVCPFDCSTCREGEDEE